MTTGPLGQGFANGVGMGISERWLRARFGPELCDHHTFVICSDGDLSEGISHEAASLAGHLGLGRLVYVYDDNHITIDGPTELSLTDRPGDRFRAYGWDVDEIGEVANDPDALEAAVRRAMAQEAAPTLIVCAATSATHRRSTPTARWPTGRPSARTRSGPPRRSSACRPTRRSGCPTRSRRCTASRGGGRRPLRLEWERRLAAAPNRDVIDACLAGRGLEGWDAKLPTWPVGESVATRKASGAVLEAIADVVPGLVGGGADLTGNTGTKLAGHGVQSATDPGGRQIYFGVREHGMAGTMNGMAMHGGTLPFGGTFFVFSDYMKPAVRLASISGAHVIYSWTHDSIGLGEDGPTHQPVEQLAGLRAIPGLRLVRPADANETAQAWRVAVDSDGPVGLVLTRQDLPVLEGTAGNEGVLKGAYVLVESDGDPDLVLIGTGSEVHLCVEAAKLLDVATRVVSMPSWELFEEQGEDYQDAVLPPEVPTLAVEAGVSLGWERWADDVVALDRFGASAPWKVVYERLGYTAENVAERARELLEDLV